MWEKIEKENFTVNQDWDLKPNDDFFAKDRKAVPFQDKLTFGTCN